MTLRIDGAPIDLAGTTPLALPTLIEDRPTVLEWDAEPADEVSLVLDGRSRDDWAARDLHRPGTVVWRWDRTRFGRVGLVDCVIESNGSIVVQTTLSIVPAKLTMSDYADILADIGRLAYSIVYDLRQESYDIVKWAPPSRVPPSGLEWLALLPVLVARLERALDDIARQPHVQLAVEERERPLWEVAHPGPGALRAVVHAEARDLMPDPARLVPLLSGPLGGYVPSRLPSETHLASSDTYENRIIVAFIGELTTRLRAVRTWCPPVESTLISTLVRRCDSLRELPFLEGVRPLDRPPTPSLVMLRNVRYRQFWEVYRRFGWILRVPAQDDPAGDDPFRLTTQRVFDTYERWAYLKVVEAVKAVTGGVVSEATWARLITFREPLVDLRDNDFTLVSSSTGDVRVWNQRTFRRAAQIEDPSSLSYSKIPDVVVERIGQHGALALDAKYRLDSENDEARIQGIGRPNRDDIDKMHAYRDAVRRQGESYLERAFILYPNAAGHAVSFDAGKIGAVALHPRASEDRLLAVVRDYLFPSASSTSGVGSVA